MGVEAEKASELHTPPMNSWRPAPDSYHYLIGRHSTSRKWCGKAPGFGKDRCGSSKH
ncbi:hypothetical protein I79_002643 [Cricetulus griseus]|uniref:Uncharacterized protein n=1 Tax=Cricetulus griseus TaxID=10029 RepID=G3GXZ6_CRIGR|nr:hypothetical protein I79_002643 [Cricetulus griseus]